jgi:quinoprotein glucose dehydrogenase
MRWARWALAAAAAATLSLGALSFARAGAQSGDDGWPAYGGDAGGQRFSAARQITPANVAKLGVAWEFSTGALSRHKADIKRSAFENTPILAEGRLYLCSPFDAVFALDPGTGKKLWAFDPRIDPGLHYPNSYNCRGVAYWRDRAGHGRIFLGTNDRRLIALDAKTGKPVKSFGRNGTVTFDPGRLTRRAGMQITSAPVVARGVVVIGSSIDDNQRVDEVPGTVRAFDAMTGAPKWQFNPLAGAHVRAGAANVWAPMSVDEARGLVFLPTSSASPDFYASNRPGDDRNADSVVALDIETGRLVWAFQTVHHDVWDYDIPAQPTLGTVTYKGRTVDAVLQPTKTGLLFTLDRETGKPVIPVVERKVPQDGAPGEELSPTQPFPVAPKPLTPNRIKADDAFGFTFWDRGRCRNAIKNARHDGLFTPPGVKGTIVYPFTGGGTNWGGLAFDARHDIAYVNTSNVMHLVTLIPQQDFMRARAAEPDVEISQQKGVRYGMRRAVLTSPFGIPCNPPPWGELHAVDMNSGKVLWSVPLGTTEDMVPFSQYFLGNTGTPNLGGPIVTAGGLVFIGAAMDDYLRAFDAKTGRELWKGRLPAGGQATPMTYVWKGRQYVVIAAGGHEKLGTRRGDKIVAFALPQ